MTNPAPTDVNTLIERLEKRAVEDRKCAKNNTVVADLLKPQMDAFDARSEHNLYAVRMELEHRKSAKRDSQYADDLEQAAQALRAMQARVGELGNLLAEVAPHVHHTTDLRERADRALLEYYDWSRKLDHDISTQQEAQRHGE